MKKNSHSHRQQAFTLVELMLVVVIVAILSLVALPIYQGHIVAGKMSEGITGAGLIRTALRVQASHSSGAYPDITNATGSDLNSLGIRSSDLDGKYFHPDDYLVNSQAVGFYIKVTLASDPDYWYQVDNDGNEVRHGF